MSEDTDECIVIFETGDPSLTKRIIAAAQDSLQFFGKQGRRRVCVLAESVDERRAYKNAETLIHKQFQWEAGVLYSLLFHIHEDPRNPRLRKFIYDSTQQEGVELQLLVLLENGSVEEATSSPRST